MGSYAFELASVSKTGTLRWTSTTGYAISSKPAFSPDGTVVYVHCNDFYVYAIRTSNGQQLWQTKVAERTTEMSGKFADPVVGNDGVILLPTADARVVSLNPDGTFMWTADVLNMTGQTQNLTELDAFAPTAIIDIVQPVVRDGDQIFIATLSHVLCLRGADGVLAWKQHLGTGVDVSDVAVGKNRHVFTVAVPTRLRYEFFSAPVDDGLFDDEVTCTLQAVTHDGEYAWSADIGPCVGRIYPYVLSDGNVIVSNAVGDIMAFTEHGAVAWSINTLPLQITPATKNELGYQTIVTQYKLNKYAAPREAPDGTIVVQTSRGFVLGIGSSQGPHPNSVAVSSVFEASVIACHTTEHLAKIWAETFGSLGNHKPLSGLVVSDDSVYETGYLYEDPDTKKDGHVYLRRLHAATGDTVWKVDTPNIGTDLQHRFVPPAIGTDSVYLLHEKDTGRKIDVAGSEEKECHVGSCSAVLTAYHAADGHVLWTTGMTKADPILGATVASTRSGERTDYCTDTPKGCLWWHLPGLCRTVIDMLACAVFVQVRK